jgi:hypothetical protein
VPLGVDVFPDGTAMGIGIVVAEVGMVAELIPDASGTAMVAGTVVMVFMEVAKVISDGTTGVAKVAVVSEVTKGNPDEKSMGLSVAASLANLKLAPVSAITLAI